MRASARIAVNVLGLLFLWAVSSPSPATPRRPRSRSGSWDSAPARGRCTDGRLSATAEWLNMYDPSRRHLQEAVRVGEWKRDEDDDGDGPDPSVSIDTRRVLERSRPQR